MMEERTIKAWIPKNLKMKEIFYWRDKELPYLQCSLDIFKTRGKKEEWAEGWPPKSIEVTVKIRD